jgi:hypothetical protein
MRAGYRREHFEPGVSTQDRWYIFRVRAFRSLAMASVLTALVLGCSGNATHPRAVPTTPPPSGEAGKPAGVVIADARKALLAATSVHVTGTITVAPAATGTQAQRFDLRLTRIKKQPAATGTVTTVTRAGTKTTSVTLDLVRVGSAIYIRGDRAYYARIGPKAAAVAGRWLSFPASQDRSVAGLTDIATLSAGISTGARDRISGSARLNGVTVVVVMAGASSKLYVSASGPPRPVRLQRALAQPAGATATLDFSGYDAPLTVAAPVGAIPLAKVR